MRLVSRRNTATYLRETVTYVSASKDFRKLIGLIDTFPEPGKLELSALIFPIFVYFYILLMQSAPSGLVDAKAFYKKNRDIFAYADSYDEILETLHSFKNWADVKKDSYFKNFLECKYSVSISPDTLKALKDFIKSEAKEEGDKALLYVLHFHILFEDHDEVEYTDNICEEMLKPVSERNASRNVEHENEKVRPDGVSNPKLVRDKLPTSRSRSSDNDGKSVKHNDAQSETELAALLKEMNLNHPHISAVVAKCVAADLSSVDFNNDETEIAYAFGNNCIYIAPLGRKKEQVTKRSTDNSDDKTRKKPRLEEETIEIVPSQFSEIKESTGKRGKPQKKTNNKKTKRGSKRPQEVSSKACATGDVGKKSHDDRNVKEIKLPDVNNLHIVKYLPGKSQFLLAVCDSKVKLFNTKTCTFEAEYVGNDSFIFDIDVNSTSQYFATAKMDTVACLYKFDVSIAIKNFVGHLRAVTSVRFHPNGLYVATGSDDSTVRLFDIDRGLCVRKFSDNMSSILTLAFSPDGKQLASGDALGTVKVWDIKDGSEISKICFSQDIDSLARITSLCFHSDSAFLMACNRKGECKLWNVRNLENLQVINFKNIPLLIKFCKNGLWKMAFQENVK